MLCFDTLITFAPFSEGSFSLIQRVNFLTNHNHAKNFMNTIQLTRKLISIPSYVKGKNNEKKIGDFAFRFLKAIPYLEVQKQEIGDGRFNIIAQTKGRPRLLLAGHLDTVEPKQGWFRNQFQGNIENSRLYGLGSLDTKAGIAAILSSLAGLTKVSGLTLLFYCDEEYDFQGMKQFIKRNKRRTPWELAVIVEPTDLKIWNAQRGIIEISFSVQGKSGHAANPSSGKNAIDGVASAISELRIWLEKFQDKVLGIPTLNLAYMRGGLNQCVNAKGQVVLGKAGNNIADFAEATIDIRPTKATLKAKDVIKQLNIALAKQGVRLLGYSIRHDFGVLRTDPRELKTLEKVLKEKCGKAEYLSAKNSGYGDGQLLAEKLMVPVVYIGPKGSNAHGPNEWVDTRSIEKLKSIFNALIKIYCTRG